MHNKLIRAGKKNEVNQELIGSLRQAYDVD